MKATILDFWRRLSTPANTLDGQAEDGGVFVYDLLQSSIIPVASAHLLRGSGSGGGVNPTKSRGVAAADAGEGGAAVTAYSVTFNPRQRDLVATGDSLGRVIIWRTSWPLSNKRPGEDVGLERLFKGSVGDVSVVRARTPGVENRSCFGGYFFWQGCLRLGPDSGTRLVVHVRSSVLHQPSSFPEICQMVGLGLGLALGFKSQSYFNHFVEARPCSILYTTLHFFLDASRPILTLNMIVLV